MSTVPSGREFSPHGLRTLTHAEAYYPRGVAKKLEYPRFPAWGLLARAAARVPDRTAVEIFGHRMTYAQVDASSRQLANHLQARGIGAGDRVAILLPNVPEYLIGLNAIWRAGGVAVAVSPLSVPSEVSQLLRFTDCRTVICLDLLSDLLRKSDHVKHTLLTSLHRYLPAWKKGGYWAARWHRTGHINFPKSNGQQWFWQAIEHASTSLDPVECVPEANPAYILSTGGTTGFPKAVTLSHQNIVANAIQQAAWAGGSMGEESMLAVLPFFHSYGMSTMLGSGAALGAKLTLQPRFKPKDALRAIQKNRPTVFHAVPAMLSAMNQTLRRRSFNLSSLKWVISGGASLPVSIAEEFAGHSGALVVEGYGLSEASPVTHVGPLDGNNQLGTIGLPLPDTEARIVDADTGRNVPTGQVGELIVKGPQVMLGYWSNKAATQSVLRDGWLSTGDLAVRKPSGFYQIVDRKKDLIITSGFNVYPSDVEEIIRQFDGVADVAVVGVPDSHRGEVVKAFVVLDPHVMWNPSHLGTQCKEKLAAHRRPRLWQQVDDLPRNFLGKVLRRSLRE